MLSILLWNIFVFAAGAVSIVVSAWWWITTLELPEPETKRPTVTDTSLPEELVDRLKQGDGFRRRETCLALNLILQFFFQEKRYEAGIMRWLTNILTLEFNDLLRHKALSKFIHNMQIRDLNLGANFPVIRAVTAKHVNLNPDTSTLEQIDIMVEVEYNGGIQLAIDASSRLSKTAMVKIKVVHLSGNGRLQFSRHPFTHWSFSFYEEPQVEFEVYSSLGLHIPRFNSIIVSQLRGILKRKHTLPYFKLRGPPLVKRQTQAINEEGCSVPSGRLTGSIVKCTRLQAALVGEVMYCTVILSEVPIVCAVEKPSGLWVIQDITLKRPHGSSAGILLRNADEGMQMVESVQQNSPAHAAGLRKNDVLLAVNGTYLNSGQQAAKLFSTSNINGDSNSITLRVKRLIQPEPKKMVAEQRAIGSDGTSPVVGEDTSGRLHVASSGQSSVAPCTTNSSHSGDKSSSAWVDTSSSGTSGCVGASDVGIARGGEGVSCSSVMGSSSHGGGCRAGGSEAGTTASSVCGGGSSDAGSSSHGTGGGSKGIDHPGNSYVGSSGSGPSLGSTSGGTDDDSVPGGSRAVNPSHLLAGIMGTFNGGRPAKHRSLPGSPVLQRTSRNRINSTRDGDVSGSGRSTPDSSHNSSPELKRKLLDLHTFPADSRPILSNQDKSPVTVVTSKSLLRPLAGIGQDKSPASSFANQSFPVSQPVYEKPPSNQSSKAGTPTSPEISVLNNPERRGIRRHIGKSRTHLKILQTPFVDGSSVSIWLKDAYQCGECGIICHKKCMVRCEQETVCDAGGLRYRDSPKTEIRDGRDNKETPPEIITTVVANSGGDNGSPGNTPPVSPQTQRRTLGSLFAQVASASKGSLKRAGSAHNLAPPNPSPGGTLSRSLPPSPPHSPQHSRKASLSESSNPFVVDWDKGDNIQSVLDRLMGFPHDERLVTLARDSAKDLHSLLPEPERTEKINETLAKLQTAIDNEGEVRVDLARQEREACEGGDDLIRASIALQISQCDARTQALALLTLHYCTALQYCTTDFKDDGEEVKKDSSSNQENYNSKNKDSPTKKEKQAEG
ncbi:uncharacterized protein Pdzd8 [Panulirus ornatus]|uniref:uncharacterized protein Pdzd8 n=1 Tax=Panulirus ornatus TaxID=150431 RepID=UPI003A860D3C